MWEKEREILYPHTCRMDQVLFDYLIAADPGDPIGPYAERVIPFDWQNSVSSCWGNQAWHSTCKPTTLYLILQDQLFRFLLPCSVYWQQLIMMTVSITWLLVGLILAASQTLFTCSMLKFDRPRAFTKPASTNFSISWTSIVVPY